MADPTTDPPGGTDHTSTGPVNHHLEPHAAGWLDRPANVELIVKALYVVCAAVFLADIFIVKHGKFEIEHWFGFYAIYGFIACVVLVLAATQMRRVLMKDEDYYDQ